MYNKIKNIVIVFLLITAYSCDDFETDLDVENTNNPDLAIIATDKASLEAIASSVPRSWFMTVSGTKAPGAAFNTMADISTCSWGNFGMKDLSSEPRAPFNNTTSYGNDVTSQYFDDLYSVYANSNMVLYALDNNTVTFDNPEMMELAAKMGRALSIGYISLVFDSVWIHEEGEITKVSYQKGMEFALQNLDEAIAIANTGVGMPDGSFPGADVSGPSISKLLNSLGARMLVGNVRNSSQKANIDWAKVKQYASNGIDADFTIFMDDVVWYDLIPKTYLVYPGWGRVDMRIINMMDSNTPNYWTDDLTIIPESTSNDLRLITDFQYLSSNNFRPDRGLYHFSSYRYSRHDTYITDWVMDLVEYSKAENDLYLAEAELELGNVTQAASIVNAGTRTTRGGLANVNANYDDVKSAIFYERMVELGFSTMGIGFFEMRKEDLLQPGTLLHFPVPGKTLETLNEPIYTFGGTSGVAGEDYSNGGWRD